MIPVPHFKKEVMHWAEEIQVTPKEIHVRAMNTKWTSCSNKGRLNPKLSLARSTMNPKKLETKP
jgi:predicted metal-dependent hydrolase